MSPEKPGKKTLIEVALPLEAINKVSGQHDFGGRKRETRYYPENKVLNYVLKPSGIPQVQSAG
ncbi:MAG: hypothetical protein C4575_05795 [Desulforudis sp.]|jgi:hypothetical protein|nr:MAG: hypothetical protein C4575_05795 [Desulforudis sp.]